MKFIEVKGHDLERKEQDMGIAKIALNDFIMIYGHTGVSNAKYA